MEDLYKKAILNEQEALKAYRCNVVVDIKEERINKTHIYATVSGIAALLLLVTFLIAPGKEVRQLKRADRFIAALDISFQQQEYSFNAGQKSIDKFNATVEKYGFISKSVGSDAKESRSKEWRNPDMHQDFALIKKFNTIIDKYESKN